jgi:ribonuclease HI
MSKNEIKLYTDGCARGNPGPAGAGFVILDMKGKEIETGFKFLGNSQTNNQAEYGALILGLSKCLNHSKGVIHVYSDSELMVKQLTGAYRISKPHLRELAKNVRTLMEGFQKVTFQHIKRNKNSRADDLANQAVDQVLKK